MKYLSIILISLISCKTATIPTTQPEVVEVLPEIVVQPKQVFVVKSSLKYMQEVARISNCVINSPEFIKRLAEFPIYTHTKLTPDVVAREFQNVPTITLTTYRTSNPFSKVTATTFANQPGVVYFNLRNNPRPMPTMVNTAIHEASHVLGFDHGDNNPKGKEDSVPYRSGKLAEDFVTGCL
jgi:hypothetical protein